MAGAGGPVPLHQRGRHLVRGAPAPAPGDGAALRPRRPPRRHRRDGAAGQLPQHGRRPDLARRPAPGSRATATGPPRGRCSSCSTRRTRPAVHGRQRLRRRLPQRRRRAQLERRRRRAPQPDRPGPGRAPQAHDRDRWSPSRTRAWPAPPTRAPPGRRPAACPSRTPRRSSSSPARGRRCTWPACGARSSARPTGAAAGSSLPALPRPVRLLSAWTGAPPLPRSLGRRGPGGGAVEPDPSSPPSPPPPSRRRTTGASSPRRRTTSPPPSTPSTSPGADWSASASPAPRSSTRSGRLVQYFQRGRLEYHPERRNTPYEVQISLLGEWLAAAGRRSPGSSRSRAARTMRYFEETGHSVNYAFLRYWNTRNGLDSFGFPITEELAENGRPVQYFQRGRLEYRPEAAGTRDEVQAGAGRRRGAAPAGLARLEGPMSRVGPRTSDSTHGSDANRRHARPGHRPARRPAPRCCAAGVDVVRLNASHGTQADHKRRLDAARAGGRRAGAPAGRAARPAGAQGARRGHPGAGRRLHPDTSVVLSNRPDATPAGGHPGRLRAPAARGAPGGRACCWTTAS